MNLTYVRLNICTFRETLQFPPYQKGIVGLSPDSNKLRQKTSTKIWNPFYELFVVSYFEIVMGA